VASTSLIVAPQWIGDAVMTEPLMRRLHARGEQLTVGALPWVAPVYRAMPHVHAVIEFPFRHGGLQWQARRAMAKQLRGQFDNAYVLPNSLKSALLPFLAGIRRRVGYSGESRFVLLNERLTNPKGERPPMVAYYSALSGEGAIGDLVQDRPHLQLPENVVAQALQHLGVTRGSFAVFAPGAEFGPAKRWPAAHFASLAKSLAEQGIPVLLLGSGKESPLCEEIAAPVLAQHPGSVFNLAGKTTLEQALSAISAAKFVVSNDSGLMHVAAAFGVPQVAVFGSSSPLHTPPLNPLATVFWLKNDLSYQPPLDCAPCFQRTCPLGHTRCLVDVTPEKVLGALA
jgi:heptosyltransferase-2